MKVKSTHKVLLRDRKKIEGFEGFDSFDSFDSFDMMDCCKEEVLPCQSFEIGTNGRTFYNNGIVPIVNRFDFNIGTFYLSESYTPYIGISYAAEFGHRPSSILKVSTAMTSDRGLFNKIEYNYYLYAFNLMSFNSSTSWSNYNNFRPKYKSRLLVGMSANSLHDLEGVDQFFSEAHFGINFEKIYPRYLSSVYFLTGGGYNFSKTENQFGPYFELGTSINLYKRYPGFRKY